MDLLATVRKEGSRGGRGDFKWSDVQSSSHRENYLGHSLMAPVGRWQKGRDLNWYAKGDSDPDANEDPAARAARERKEEIRRVKEAEEDAMAKALGLPVAPRNNPNLEELGAQREVGRVLKEAAEEDTAATRGVGFGRVAGAGARDEGQPNTDRLEGTSTGPDRELQYALKEYKRRQSDRRHRSRSRSKDRHKDRHERRRRDDRHRRSERRSRSPRRAKSGRERSRSPSHDRDRDRDRERNQRKPSRSRSPSHRRHESYRHDKERRDARR